jgi:hypothetical protein
LLDFDVSYQIRAAPAMICSSRALVRKQLMDGGGQDTLDFSNKDVAEAKISTNDHTGI